MKNKSRAIVLIAHGSRVEAANEEIRLLASQLQDKIETPVVAAFLELASPDIPEGIDLALQKSPREILVLPYFLTQGRHVQEDIPKILADKARAYPETTIRLLPYFGKDLAVLEVLAGIAEKNG
ncbi:MAG: CbiX/SirB N-terminal domain-containing protein [Deltaproteobacteria bacterium]|nr:CbiX/SirB N-terminal domain-containing protein [Deltaproteobacteria bacterium]